MYEMVIAMFPVIGFDYFKWLLRLEPWIDLQLDNVMFNRSLKSHGCISGNSFLGKYAHVCMSTVRKEGKEANWLGLR